MRAAKFDAWIESFTPPFSTTCLQMFTAKPVIGLAHMLAAEDMRQKYKLPFELLERAGLKTYRYFITVSQAGRSALERVNPQAATYVIPNGVDSPKSSSRQLKHRNRYGDYLLYLGRIEMNQKGLDLLLAAFSQLKPATGIKLVIAGHGIPSQHRQLHHQISLLGLEERVVIAGQVSGDDKTALLQNCRAVVVPSRRESFCMVVLEAMVQGKPVVSFAIEGLAWATSPAVLKAKTWDVGSFAEQISRVLNDNAITQQAASLACQTRLNYSWDAVAEQYRTALREVLHHEQA
jgi:glycosyltransferase involved in cell wall biosynthesis